MFLMLHGCRPGEARALKAKRVALGTMSVEIRETYSGKEIRPRRKGKRSKPYSLPIHPEMTDFFTDRVKNSLPEAFIFTNPRNGLPYSMSALGRLWASVRDKMNLSKDLRLYDLTRHSVGSQLCSTGVGLEAIRDILGHSSSRTTERYVHHEKLEMKRGVLSRLSLKGEPGGVIDIKRPAYRSG
jgi:integrase